MSFKFCEPEVSQRSMERVYKPLQGITTATGPRIALLILNWPLHGMLPKLNALWSKACVKICVDGGANHLFEVTKEDSSEELTPDIISGDFDSARENVLEYYSDRGCEIVRTPDQNETDFTKALMHLMSCQDKFDFEEVVALCGFGSRLDQLFANVDTLFKVSALTSKPVYLLSEDSLSVLLRPGEKTTWSGDGDGGGVRVAPEKLPYRGWGTKWQCYTPVTR